MGIATELPTPEISIKGNKRRADHLWFFGLTDEKLSTSPKILDYSNYSKKVFWNGFCQNLENFYAICNPIYPKPVY